MKKIKDENALLKDQVNDLRSKNDIYEKALKKINVNKMSSTDLVIDLDNKNKELNKLREIAHTFIYDIKDLMKNAEDYNIESKYIGLFTNIANSNKTPCNYKKKP